MKEHWLLDPIFRQEFLDACKEAATNDEAFKNFRQHPRIHTVIENTPKWWADKAMEVMGWTPTMIRYRYMIHLMEKLLPYPLFDHNSIIEIGAGYGGLLELLVENHDFEYTVYDLPEVILLQQRYLEYKHVEDAENITFHSDPSVPSDYADLCISWAAWSELSTALKKQYAHNVIGGCKRFFICSNYNMEEDIEILRPYFRNIKTYSDDLVSNVIYC